MITSYLEHQKAIIKNIIHDQSLIEKELYKSRLWLNDAEQNALCNWLEETYPNQYYEVLCSLEEQKFQILIPLKSA